MDKSALFFGKLNLIQAAEMREGTREAALNDLTGVTRFIYETAPSNTVAGYITFFLVLILCIIVYKLGFARKIKLWQNVVIYACLFLGCIILTFFALSLPMIEGLMVAAAFLGIYKIRLRSDQKKEATEK